MTLDNRAVASLFVESQALRCYSDFYDKAIADYRRAIALDPKDARAYFYLGVARYDENDTVGAIAEFDRAIQANPRLSDAFYDRGCLKSNKHDHDGAISDFSRAIALDPEDAEALLARSNVESTDKKDSESARLDRELASSLSKSAGRAFGLLSGPQVRRPNTLTVFMGIPAPYVSIQPVKL